VGFDHTRQKSYLKGSLHLRDLLGKSLNPIIKMKASLKYCAGGHGRKRQQIVAARQPGSLYGTVSG